MRILGFGVSAAFLIVAASCGGKTDAQQTDGGTECPLFVSSGSACSTEGAKCEFGNMQCSNGTPSSCTCSQGEWVCQTDDCPPPPPNQCGDGVSCSGSSHCEIPVSDCGFNATISCNCQNGHYSCIEPDCPQPVCPPPSAVKAGGSCVTQGPESLCPSNIPDYDCDGNVIGYEECWCASGAWSCNATSAVCDAGSPIDAGTSD